MKITWLGHACFALEADGCRVVIDPYKLDCYPPLALSAQAVYCSHGHYDHNYEEAVTLLPAQAQPFTVQKLPSFHDGARGAQRGENTIHCFTAQGLRVAHLGDLGHLPDAVLCRAIGSCDALLVPIGGYYTIDPAQAAETVRLLRPRVIVPMHYYHKPFGLSELAGVEAFLACFPAAQVRCLTENNFDLTAETPSGIVVPAFTGAIE